MKLAAAKLEKLHSPLLRGLRALGFALGMVGFIVGVVLFWGVFAAENTFHLSGKGWVYLLGVLVWLALCMFISLWSINKNCVVNYLRMSVFPPAVLMAMQFGGGPAFGLFYFATVFVAVVIGWNIVLWLTSWVISSGK